MLALCLMLSGTYYAKNYASIIGRGLIYSLCTKVLEDSSNKSCMGYHVFTSICILPIARISLLRELLAWNTKRRFPAHTNLAGYHGHCGEEATTQTDRILLPTSLSSPRAWVITSMVITKIIIDNNIIYEHVPCT